MANNLPDILRESSVLNDVGINFIDGSTDDYFLSYNELYSRALSGADYLQEQGLNQGDELVLQLNNNKEFVIVFWSCILCGVIPVPVTVGHNKEHRKKLARICSVLDKPKLITDEDTLQRLEKAAEESEYNDDFSDFADDTPQREYTGPKVNLNN